MSATVLDRLYVPSPDRPQCAHLCPAAILSGFTLCSQPTDGMAGREPDERAIADGLKVCTKCYRVLHPPFRFSDLSRPTPST